MFYQKITLTIFLGLFILQSCSESESTRNDDTVIIEEAIEDENKSAGQTDQAEKAVETEILAPSPRLSGKYTITPYQSDSLGWGYTISEGKKVVVNQPHIPAISGIRGFSSKEKAMRAGEEVAFKLEQGLMPPSLTIEEMKSIHVLE